ncbi:ester cyclase [Paraburkholderia sp. J63]|uniref:ester cyclase n=1 Tax=Paraburkholderia sp. J63 TaxID=2805434 RepID=UPI002ABD45DA|nr:ester cyclase [Paraburkholderia sp. J63]
MKYESGKYTSVPDYIYGITREIWEDRGIGRKLQEYYAADILLRAPTGFTGSNEGVVSQTLQTLHQFPDRQLIGEDVIWTGYDDGSFLSSHRLTSVMRHTGDGILGPATGRLVRSRIIADCWVKGGKVVEEWLVRDQAAFARCLGIEPSALARQMVERELQNGQAVTFFLPEHDQLSALEDPVPEDGTVLAITEHLHRIWGEKDTSGVRDLYFSGALLHAPGGDVRYGHDDIDTFVVGYLASFPDAVFQIDAARVNRDIERPVRIALRWSLRGTHSGFGHFGEPTGAAVYVMGMTHLDVTQGRVVSEYTVTDEVSIWKQIHAHRLGCAKG